MDGLEELHGLETRTGRDPRAAPELLYQGAMRGVIQVHMGGQHVGHATHFPSSHGVGLAGEGQRTHAGAPDPAGQQMAVDDAVHLVRAGGRLVHAL